MKSDIFIVTFNREFNPTEQPYLINYISSPKNKTILDKIINYPKYFNYSKYIDRTINSLIADEYFTLYINYAYGSNRLIMTNSKCTGISFIEEGMDNYKEDDLFSFTIHSKSNSYRSSFAKRFFFLKKITKDIFKGKINEKLILIPSHPSCYALIPETRYFSFSKYSFPNIQDQRKCTLDILSLIDNFDRSNIKSIDNSLLWVGDNVVNFYNIPVDKYISAINNGFSTFSNKYKFSKIYLKFHPNEDVKSKVETKQLFDKLDCETIVIDDSQSIELLLLNSKNIKIIGLTSSLLWYSSLMGHEAFSVNRFLKEHNHLSDDSIFWDRVISL